MLAWLHREAGHVTIRTWDGGATADAPYVDHAPIEGASRDIKVRTLNEALCRLILAVDGAKKESKKP
jgi:hypothetical protein